MAKSASGLPGPLANAARRFEAWRRGRTTQRIPDELWSLAADLGTRFGVSCTARALRVQYYTLKKHMDTAATRGSNEEGTHPAFVEFWRAPTTAALPESCRVEFERASGEKMRVHLGGVYGTDLALLARLFLEEAR